eukprot:11900522-Alexandrium_andersonii.AAC.1
MEPRRVPDPRPERSRSPVPAGEDPPQFYESTCLCGAKVQDWRVADWRIADRRIADSRIAQWRSERIAKLRIADWRIARCCDWAISPHAHRRIGDMHEHCCIMHH